MLIYIKWSFFFWLSVKDSQETGLEYESLYEQNVCGRVHNHSNSSLHISAIQEFSQLPDRDQVRGYIR